MSTNQELKEEQRRQWSGNAANWDRQHDRQERDTRPVTDWLCKAAGLAPGMRVLDLACGSGHPALEEARLVRPGGSVVATDLAPEMVDATLRRARDAGLDNLEARVADAENIDYQDESFDAVTMRFGLMFCPQPARAVSEIRRVLRTEGRFALSVWDDLALNPAHTVLNQALEKIGRSNPGTEQSGSPYTLSKPGALASVLKAGGFAQFETASISMLWTYGSASEFWEQRALRVPQVHKLLAENDSEQIERLREALLEILRAHGSGSRIELAATALCATGQK